MQWITTMPCTSTRSRSLDGPGGRDVVERSLDFPLTRAAIGRMPAWVNELASTLPNPVKVDVPGFGFRWEHEDKTAEVAQVAKAVRVATALRAALALADMRLTTDACSLLRMIGDFNNEIMLLGEGLLSGKLTKAQERFVDQQFETHPLSPDELAEQEPVHYEGRGAAINAMGRLMEKWKGLTGQHARITTYLAKGLDRYVHGKYGTAMELFNPVTRSFALTGAGSQRQVLDVKVAVAGKTVESIHALRFMAITRRMDRLEKEMDEAADAISASPRG